MPKVPMFTLAWSSATGAYELYETRDRGVLGIVPDSPAWFTWLDQVSSFALVGKSGRYTARREARRHSNRYWYAYLVTGTQLTKKYLGKTSDLSLARLEHIASEMSANQAASRQLRQAAPLLHAQSGVQVSSPVSLGAIGAEDEVDSARRPTLAQERTPINPLLATKLHAPRLRMHLVSRAHLVERLQRSMASPLTLVSAPAGFGKTTLLAQW
ncbi:MAG TPA: hypothetical protein VKB35_14925, partial [Ktedonobacteraceae bacterium]|nr:hypothetical protein [Ktedonobacteraceae bacterium]